MIVFLDFQRIHNFHCNFIFKPWFSTNDPVITLSHSTVTLVFCKTPMLCTFTECFTNWLTTYGPNPRRRWSAGFTLHITHTHKHHMHTQFHWVQYIISPVSHVCTHLGPKYVKLCFFMDMQSPLKTQHSSQQLTIRVKNGKWALVLQQEVLTNMGRWDGHGQPECDSRNSICIRSEYPCSFCSNESCLLRSSLPLCKAEQASPAVGHD